MEALYKAQLRDCKGKEVGRDGVVWYKVRDVLADTAGQLSLEVQYPDGGISTRDVPGQEVDVYRD